MQGFWKQLATERDKDVKVCVVVVVMGVVVSVFLTNLASSLQERQTGKLIVLILCFEPSLP